MLSSIVIVFKYDNFCLWERIFKLISFIDAADYVIGQFDSLCENGMIDNQSECEKAAEQLNLSFESDENEEDYPGGCYLMESEFWMHDDGSDKYVVYFNKNLQGTSDISAKPICRQGKYDKYYIKIFELWYIDDFMIWFLNVCQQCPIWNLQTYLDWCKRRKTIIENNQKYVIPKS